MKKIISKTVTGSEDAANLRPYEYYRMALRQPNSGNLLQCLNPSGVAAFGRFVLDLTFSRTARDGAVLGQSQIVFSHGVPPKVVLRVFPEGDFQVDAIAHHFRELQLSFSEKSGLGGSGFSPFVENPLESALFEAFIARDEALHVAEMAAGIADFLADQPMFFEALEPGESVFDALPDVLRNSQSVDPNLLGQIVAVKQFIREEEKAYEAIKARGLAGRLSEKSQEADRARSVLESKVRDYHDLVAATMEELEKKREGMVTELEAFLASDRRQLEQLRQSEASLGEMQSKMVALQRQIREMALQLNCAIDSLNYEEPGARQNARGIHEAIGRGIGGHLESEQVALKSKLRDGISESQADEVSGSVGQFAASAYQSALILDSTWLGDIQKTAREIQSMILELANFRQTFQPQQQTYKRSLTTLQKQRHAFEKKYTSLRQDFENYLGQQKRLIVTAWKELQRLYEAFTGFLGAKLAMPEHVKSHSKAFTEDRQRISDGVDEYNSYVAQIASGNQQISRLDQAIEAGIRERNRIVSEHNHQLVLMEGLAASGS